MTEQDNLSYQANLTPDQKIEFAEFYRTDMPKLVAFVMRLGAGLSEANDIAQQAFVSAYLRWPAIHQPGAYLRTSASREFMRRSFSNTREVSQADLPDAAAVPDLSVSKVEFRDQETRVFEAIKSLPARQRQVIAWTLDGFSPTEIAGILEISAGTVRGSLLKARRELKLRLHLTQGGDVDV